MATNNTTFWNLIDTYKISIPIIQRDYALGRKEEDEKRENFLNAILKHIKSNDGNLHLNFVYGRIKDNTFYPIDGQQRLTTLFLLHWYFALKENIPIEQKSKLSQFVYDTRISSREFCQSLIREDIEIPSTKDDDGIFKSIKNKYWYRNTWDTDPTVKAMLVIIQAIHNKFHNINSTTVFNQLINDKPISFELLDLGAKGFELTDELYIKMNARGKQLTPFENFKANFIQLIDKNFKDKKLNHPIKGEISYSGYFSYKVEKEWTDLFWVFRGDKNTTDDGFSNYFEFITQMLYFKKYKESKVDEFKNTFSQYEDIYGNEENPGNDENLLILFNSLDKLYEVLNTGGDHKKNNLNELFNSITDKTSFFWNGTNNHSLFEIIVFKTKNEEVRNKILLFAILHYLVKHNLSSVNIQLENYVRVIRNLMQATRQRNDTKYNTNIRINNFGSYWLLFEQLSANDVYQKIQDQSLNNKSTQISEGSLRNEIEKINILLLSSQNTKTALLGLEECGVFEGLIHQLKPQLNQSNLQEYLKAIDEIWHTSISDTLRIQALIASGFEGMKIKDTKMGSTFYFGKDGNWSVILTSEEKQVSKNILILLDKFNISELPDTEKKLQAIVNDWLSDNQNDRTYKYYFLKYSTITSKLNYFVRPNSYEIQLLGTEGSNPLVAYHISPYVLAVCKKVNDKSICDEKQSYLQYSGNSPLFLKNGITMTSKEEGWIINVNSSISDSLISKYSLVTKVDYYVLKDNIHKDRIEIAVDFIFDILT